MDRKTQQQPQGGLQKAPEKEEPRNAVVADRGRWTPTRRQVLATIAIVVALVSLILIGYFIVWWPDAGQPARVVGLTVASSTAVITLTVIGYRKKWTGFGEKTLWHWMDLLIIPVVLAVGGFLFALAQDAREEYREAQRAQNQLDAEAQRGQDVALQDYLDEMGVLLLDEELRTSQETDEARRLARTRTLTVLLQVDDPGRKRSIMRFLLEEELIEKDQPLIGLVGADLSYAKLNDFPLNETYLENAGLEGANLANANLSGATLTNADLTDADLTGAYMGYANLSGATVTDSGAHKG